MCQVTWNPKGQFRGDLRAGEQDGAHPAWEQRSASCFDSSDCPPGLSPRPPGLSPQTATPKMVEAFLGVAPRPNRELPSGPGGLRGLRVVCGNPGRCHRVVALSPKEPPRFGDWPAASWVLVVLVTPGVQSALRCRPGPACPSAAGVRGLRGVLTNEGRRLCGC